MKLNPIQIPFFSLDAPIHFRSTDRRYNILSIHILTPTTLFGRSAGIPTSDTRGPVAFFTLEDDWDEVEVVLENCPVGQVRIIVFIYLAQTSSFQYSTLCHVHCGLKVSIQKLNEVVTFSDCGRELTRSYSAFK